MSDVSYTELQELVGRKLQIIGDAETLSADYADIIIDGLLSIQSQINRLGLASFDVENGIDYPYVDVFAELTAAELVDDFQIPEPRRSQMLAGAKFGMPFRTAVDRKLRDLLEGTTQKLRVKHDMVAV